MSQRLARSVSILLHPLPASGYLLLAMTALDAASFWSGVGWAALTLALCIGGPAVDLWLAIRAGRVADYHIMLRAQRPRVLAVSLGFVAVAFGVIFFAGGPQGLLLSLAVGFASGVALTLITLGWKISLHVGAVTGAVAVLWWRLGPAAGALVPVVFLVAWARLTLKRHTVAQVVAAAAVTAAVSALVILGIGTRF